MELIPILSTIILVATISTFLLAIGAYILYKVRERKGQPVYSRPPSSVEGEIISPQEVWEREKSAPKPVYHSEVIEETEQKVYPKTPKKHTVKSEKYYREEKVEEPERKNSETKYMKYTSEGYVQPKEDKSAGALRWR